MNRYKPYTQIESTLREKGKGKGKSNYRRFQLQKGEKNKCWLMTFPLSEGNPYCPICRIRKLHMAIPRSWEAGHITAHSLGGLDEAINLVPICPPCNSQQGVEHMSQFVQNSYPNNYKRFKSILLLRYYKVECLFQNMLNKIYYQQEAQLHREKSECIEKRTYICQCGACISLHYVNTENPSLVDWVIPQKVNSNFNSDELKNIVYTHFPCMDIESPLHVI